MKRWQRVLLIFELCLFAIILILPQVALPEFALHGGASPVLLKLRLSASPAHHFTSIPYTILCAELGITGQTEIPEVVVFPSVARRLSLLSILIC